MLASVSFCSLTTVFFRPETLQCCTCSSHGCFHTVSELGPGKWVSSVFGWTQLPVAISISQDHIMFIRPFLDHCATQGHRCPIKSNYLKRIVFIKQNNSLNSLFHTFPHAFRLNLVLKTHWKYVHTHPHLWVTLRANGWRAEFQEHLPAY